MSLRSTNSIIY